MRFVHFSAGRAHSFVCLLCVLCGLNHVNVDAQHATYRTLNDRFTPREYATPADWQQRASYLRDHVLASAGLIPFPDKTPLRPHVFGEVRRSGYSVSKVYFESLPGFFVTGNLYRPEGGGPFPAILSPHGHWAYGRLENTDLTSGPARAINLARQGFVVFTHDMIGFDDSRQLTHEFGGLREKLWGLSLSGLQLWNSIRSVDFLESLPDVDRDRIGATGESGGGTQTFLLAAVDPRIKVAVPVNMISLHMQGGCLCENPPGLRVDTNNVELAALFAPRPLLMVAATGDWTNETPQLEFPAMRRIYALFGAEDRVHSIQFQAPHNYNKDSREAMYGWMARWLRHQPADVRISERPSTPERLADLLVFEGRPLPDGALTAEQVTTQWIDSARRQINQSNSKVLQTALLHALAADGRPGRTGAPREASRAVSVGKTAILAGGSQELKTAFSRAGFAVQEIRFTPYDAEAAAKINHFDTYNRTAAGQQVADVVRALDESPDSVLVADAEFGPAALLALAVAPVARAVVDIDRFDNSSDQTFVDRLYIPGLRRAGDFQTAIALATGSVTVHNTGDRFKLAGARMLPAKLSAAEIVAQLR
jgi:Acetyl xylan esterase (AXE1)